MHTYIPMYCMHPLTLGRVATCMWEAESDKCVLPNRSEMGTRYNSGRLPYIHVTYITSYTHILPCAYECKHPYIYTTYIQITHHCEGVLQSTISVSGPLWFDGSKYRNIGSAQTLLPKWDACNCIHTHIHYERADETYTSLNRTHIHTYIPSSFWRERTARGRSRGQVRSARPSIAAVFHALTPLWRL